MAKRPRIQFDVDDETKLALELEALKQGVNVSTLISETLRGLFPESVKEAKRIIEQRRKVKRD